MTEFLGAMVSPWGRLEANATPIDQVKYVRAQLAWILDRGASGDPAYTRRDMEGYDAVIATGNDELAAAFFETKRGFRALGQRMENLQVVALLKRQGRWPDAPAASLRDQGEACSRSEGE